MTKYVIYPCTDNVWVTIFRRISRIAKLSGMEIRSIDFQEKSPDYIPVLHKPFTNHKKRWRAFKIFVPNTITTIILEKTPYEKDDRFVRGRKTRFEKEVNPS